ncbi:MAG: Acetyltransferase [Phycisphaerales bacterium]|nr:Acetyltransferase [Phycisphaerales bacterium]
MAAPLADRPDLRLRPATSADRDAVADLICLSTNFWYQASGRPRIFTAGPEPCGLFWDVYDALDPGCCVVAEDARTGHLAGSCFYHPRDTHVSLGIMNAHPNHFGRGVAGRLLRFVTDLADAAGLPTRLVSSAVNLDSYALYTRAGFVPGAIYQDMVVPPARVAAGLTGTDEMDLAAARARPATPADVPAIVDLEWRVARIRRPGDWQHFVNNAAGVWRVSVLDRVGGGIDGALAAVDHPGSTMLGPGVMADDAAAAALIAAELRRQAAGPRRDVSPVFLVPADRPALVRQVYAWGGRNVELHVHQVRGDYQPPTGVAMPTFMPETA